MAAVDTINGRDVQNIEDTVKAFVEAGERVDDLIQRAEEAGWTDRVSKLRNVASKTGELALEVENLLR